MPCEPFARTNIMQKHDERYQATGQFHKPHTCFRRKVIAQERHHVSLSLYPFLFLQIFLMSCCTWCFFYSYPIDWRKFALQSFTRGYLPPLIQLRCNDLFVMIKCIIIKVRLIINTTTVCPVVTYVLCSHKIVIKIKIIIYILTIYKEN